VASWQVDLGSNHAGLGVIWDELRIESRMHLESIDRVSAMPTLPCTTMLDGDGSLS
jgi:hypothetical protein